MKLFARLGLSALMLLPMGAMAQMKLGHINKQEVISKMPVVAEAKKKLEVFGKQLEDQQNELKKEFETKYNAYLQMRDDAKASKAIVATKEEELKQLQERIQKFQVTANEDFTKQQESLMKPIVEKMDVAIKAVAAEGKYAYIFDTSMGVVVYAQESDDITPQVKKKLGIL